tara:strand:+ start:2315 stop:4228 length:1914 start_codon:yes stop_codon:yes gene_type:complete
MKYCIFDVESNGLLDKATKIHCLSYAIYDGTQLLAKGSHIESKDIADFILKQTVLVGHKIIEYDVPLLEKLLEIKITAKLIDTLGISFYHYPVKGFVHGLKAWGERMGFGKPVVEDWEDQPIEVYLNRCESDVEINTRVFHFQMDYCMKIYDGDFDKVMRLFGYLGYKLDCLREQEDEKIKLDMRLAEKSKLDLEFIIDEKITNLAKHMPKIVDKVQPKVMFKQGGELSTHGKKWKALLVLKGLPEDSTEITKMGSPTSPKQLKDWLFKLGWKPKTFKLNAKQEKVAQISLPFGGGLCPSVADMFEKYGFLQELGGLYRARHRFGLFKSFLENVDDNGYIYSRAQGFTNTLRLQHAKPVANLPGVGKYYGEEVRGCLTVPNDKYIMCGSDISGLEDNTKQHYIYNFDPDYVNEMRVPGFDPHIDIAVLSGLISKEDEEFYKQVESKKSELGDGFAFSTSGDSQRFKEIKKARTQAKVINFSATYGAGAAKIAETLKCSLAEANKLHKTYWDRNAAVKKTAKACKVKTVDDQKWLYNPVSGFWMFLKAEKDRFSTLNQSTGVYVFDSWLRKVRQKLNPIGVQICLQYHDELLLVCPIQLKSKVEEILSSAMDEMNATTGLNVSIGCSVDWGNSYAECH